MCCALDDLGVAERAGEEDRVARRHVGDRDALARRFRHGDRGIGQRGVAELPDRHGEHAMLDGARAPWPPAARPRVPRRGAVHSRRRAHGSDGRARGRSRASSPSRARRRRSTTAGVPDSDTGSAARDVTPEHLVQLHLEADRQAVGEDPVRELAGRELLVARREQHLAARRRAAPAARARGSIRSRRDRRSRT